MNNLAFLTDYIEINSSLTLKLLREIKPLKSEQLLKEHENIEYCLKMLNKNPRHFEAALNCFYHIKDISLILTNLNNGIVLGETELFEIKNLIIFAQKIDALIRLDGLEIDNLSEPALYLGSNEGFIVSSPKLEQIRSQKNKDNCLEIAVLESQEELNVRKKLSQNLKVYANTLIKTLNTLGKTELIIQKAIMAKKYNLTRPKTANSISFLNLINPLINNCIGVSATLLTGSTVISGANMGGKSTLLNTLEINLSLAMCGFYVFADELSLPHLDFIALIDNAPKPNLSTFASQITLANEAFCSCLTKRGLVLIDELAFGTNADEGKKIFTAFLECFNQTDSYAVLTTHFNGVALSACAHYQTTQSYELIKTKLNAPVPQEAIKICKQLNINQLLLDKLLAKDLTF